MSFLNLPSRLRSPFAALWKNLSTACVDLCFPPLCTHCGEETRLVLCPNCSQLLELAEPVKSKGCSSHTSWAVAFEREGPTASIVSDFEKGLRPALAPALAGFLVLQLIKLNWQLPDIVIPMPDSIFDFFEKYYQPNRLLAEAASSILGCRPSSIMGKNILFVGTSLDERKARRFAHRLQEQFPSQVRGIFLIFKNGCRNNK